MKNSILILILLGFCSILMAQKPSTKPITTPGPTIDMSKINTKVDPSKYTIIEHINLSSTKNGIKISISEKEGSKKGEQKKGDPIKVNDDVTGLVCSVQKINFSETNFERIIAGGIEEKIFPGAFYHGVSIIDGSWKPYHIQRKNMKISLLDVSANSGNPDANIIPINGKLIEEQ
jgi:hypothetical protein